MCNPCRQLFSNVQGISISFLWRPGLTISVHTLLQLGDHLSLLPAESHHKVAVGGLEVESFSLLIPDTIFLLVPELIRPLSFGQWTTRKSPEFLFPPMFLFILATANLLSVFIKFVFSLQFYKLNHRLENSTSSEP